MDMYLTLILTLTINAYMCVVDPYSKEYEEGDIALLTCSQELNETIRIVSVNYHHDECIHTDKYGVENLCFNKTVCSFNVTNSNVGSSCGVNGTAILQITFNCIRNGGWTDWKITETCSEACGGGLQNLTRTCTNPSPDELGAVCDGPSVREQDCNNYMCYYDHFVCKGQTFSATCPDGYIQFIKAFWETSYNCGTFSIYTAHDVTQRLQMDYKNRRSASFTVEDQTFHVSCTQYNRICTRLSYVYMCIKATWGSWSPWSTCSGSCGIGSQFRNRSCENHVTTTDGYISECTGYSYASRVCKGIPCLNETNVSTVTIADHLPVDSQVVNILLPNEKCLIQNVKVDYTNNYFYFDTMLSSVHVKTQLPHTPGIERTQHNYSVEIEDSCKNMIKLTATIVSENMPPVIKGLPYTLTLNPNKFDRSLVMFSVEDPSPDNVSCIISNSSAPSNIFDLTLKGTNAVLSLSKNISTDVNLAIDYIIEIACNDGTETTTFELALQSQSATGKLDLDTFLIIGLSISGLLLPISVVLVVYGVHRLRHHWLQNHHNESDYTSTEFDLTTNQHQYTDLEQAIEMRPTTEVCTEFVDINSLQKSLREDVQVVPLYVNLRP